MAYNYQPYGYEAAGLYNGAYGFPYAYNGAYGYNGLYNPGYGYNAYNAYNGGYAFAAPAVNAAGYYGAPLKLVEAPKAEKQ